MFHLNISKFNKQKHIDVILCFFLFLLAVSLRVSGLKIDHPFWVDEFSTGVQAQLYQQFFTNRIQTLSIASLEPNNYLYYFITAIFFSLFGVSETVARLPNLLIGSVIPLLTFILGKKLFNRKVALSAALLITFSYFHITWSVQARSYMLLEFFGLLLFISYIDLIKSTSYALKKVFFIVILCLIALSIHGMALLFISSVVVHLLFLKRKELLKQFKRRYLVFAFIIVGLLSQTSYVSQVLNNPFFSFHNNLWYYHSFLWRELSIVTLLFTVGISRSVINKNFYTQPIILYLALHLVFISFFFGHHMTKYLLPIFPIILIFSSKGIVTITTHLTSLYKSKKLTSISAVLFTLFIILNGDTFVTKPKSFYSVNRDMREIAVIDYDKIYTYIKDRGGIEAGNTVIIETWPDRAKWYLGNNFTNLYWFRWENSGYDKMTKFKTNEAGEKYIENKDLSRTNFIGNLDDLTLVINKYPRGFIWIDDSSLPKDVIAYVEQNLKKELYLDHYYLDENPYSIWPGTLYSWGVE